MKRMKRMQVRSTEQALEVLPDVLACVSTVDMLIALESSVEQDIACCHAADMSEDAKKLEAVVDKIREAMELARDAVLLNTRVSR